VEIYDRDLMAFGKMGTASDHFLTTDRSTLPWLDLEFSTQ